ncbi:lysophospholipid acyltransferase 6 isoform X1 [Microplitis mediator]|uniref:lysophospholipid acyltransferase 6 isoform X1 n=2 Tax=Microplitis mediator TaxID=375433 RepID=UPI00255539B4|nr:lysophospholipid acyltransferase 6 isoform X1 [Microplitis mediator]
MAAIKENYYTGFHTFEKLSDTVGLPVDQTNFVLSQFTALFFAGILRVFLKPGNVRPATRHLFGLVIGLLLGYFCFGKQAAHLAGLPALCFIAMRTQDPRCVQRVVLTLALGYLSCVHYYRQIYAYGSYTLDITGPLMVITQKVIGLAYNIHDGFTRLEKDLTPLQRHQAVKIMPTTLEYFSYIFHFQALMAGPVIFYRDYMDFINGTRLKGGKSFSGFYADSSKELEEIVLEPSPTKAVIKKITASLIFAVLFVSFSSLFPIQRVKDQDFLENTTIFYKIWYLMISMFFIRCKYYYAWLFADAICNNSGMGYNGIGEDGNHRWDLIANVHPLKFELSSCLKDAISAWNIGTNRWLRMIVYDRNGPCKVFATNGLSALWHGFYPGYYLTFATGALFTYAARSVRRHIRPYFIGSKPMKFFYDVLTFTASRISMAYLAFSFVLLEFIPSVRVYTSMYLIPHLLALAAIYLLPLLPLRQSQNNLSEPSGNGHVINCITNHQPEVRNGTSKNKTE